jgi:hypothetical protein
VAVEDVEGEAGHHGVAHRGLLAEQVHGRDLGASDLPPI